MRWRSLAPLAFVGAFVAAMLLLSRSDVSQTAIRRACLSRLLIVRESNARADAHIVDRDVLLRFLRSAENARRASFARLGDREDLVAADEYRALRRRELRHVHFRILSPPTCPKK